jgi:hypothetical protein
MNFYGTVIYFRKQNIIIKFSTDINRMLKIQLQMRVNNDAFDLIVLSIYIYSWIGNKFLQLTSPSPYKYINSINKTNQMTANVQAISIIISKLSKIMSN